MIFLPGDHTLDTNITVANVARLTMHGEPSSGKIATVVCNGSVGLNFTSMMEFKIYFLAFTSCSRSYGTLPASFNYALLLRSIRYAELVNCSFHDNLATPLIVDNTNITLAGNEFTHNHCGSNFCLKRGGGVNVVNSNVAFTGNTTFFNNSILYNSTNIDCGGGAIQSSDNSILSFNGTSNFINNSAGYGGAIYTSYNTVLRFNGITNFINNSALGSGGTIYSSDNVVLSFNGTNNFINNSASYGGAIVTFDNTVLSFHGASNFINNSAYNDRDYANFTLNFADGGAIYASDNSVLSFSGTSNFINNSAIVGIGGGAIFTSNNIVLSFNGISNFISNFVDYSDGGAIYASGITVLSFNGTNNFITNTAKGVEGGHGGAIYASDNTVVRFNGTNNFINNSAYYGSGDGGVIYTSNNTLLSVNGTSNFINNSATSRGGAICANTNNSLTFNGIITFSNNGYNRDGTDALNVGTVYGGGVFLGLKSTFSILPNTTMYWENNHAALGGAIYVTDVSPLSYCTSAAKFVPKGECFFQLPGQTLIDVQLIFKNNSADFAGSVLYGGVIDNCKLTGINSHSSGEVFDMISHIDNDYSTTSKISSDPFRICSCGNHYKIPVCHHEKDSLYFIDLDAYPGETFQVSLVAVGQRDGTAPSTVRSTINYSPLAILADQYIQQTNKRFAPGALLDSQYLQKANNTCTKLNYTVFSLSDYVVIDLHAEGSWCSKFDYQYEPYIEVNVILTCPPGFNLSKSARSCVCEPRLANYTHQCNITNGVGRIARDSGLHFWVGYDNQSHGLILHPLCPFDYCVSQTVAFSLNTTNIQCAYNRSGLLCGRCKKGYSLMLGTAQCRKCTDNYLALLILFAAMGVVLVFLLLVCKLTVATGTLSGLVFYANIVGVNRVIFLPADSLLFVFIAWLNLDFGIETCFYNGLDAYSKTWLQFVFPVYIWVIVGLTILVSRYSSRFANLLGNNPVSILATLILLSYTKILRTLIAVIYITYLEYPTYNRWVWLYDANIDYLHGMHIPLFLVAVVVFFFLFLPYTLLLFFGQWLQAISHLRLFSWVNRLKPFMDSYHAPYKAKHRYWPGLLLVLRFVLLLVFAFEFNPQQDTSINLLAIQVGAGMLHLWAWISGGVYRMRFLDALEGSFALNLIILSATTYHINLSKGNQLIVGYTSISIAFATFIGILAFQLAKVTGIAQYLKNKCAAVAIRNAHQAEADIQPPDIGSLPDRLINPEEYEAPFHTPQGHAIAESPELVNEAQRRLIPVYTYGSIN